MSPIEPPLWLTGLLCIWFGMVVIFIVYLLHHLWTGRDAADLDEAFQPLDDLHLSLLHDLRDTQRREPTEPPRWTH